jgi:hypothetical protein
MLDVLLIAELWAQHLDTTQNKTLAITIVTYLAWSAKAATETRKK